MEHAPYTAPYSIHPVTGMVVDANGKSVMLCLTNAYGKAEAEAFAARLVVMLNGGQKNA